MLQAQNPMAFYKVFVSASMERFFEKESVSTEVHSWFAQNTNETLEEKERNKNLQPGDVLLIGPKNPDYGPLYHVAIFIDDDLYFEKTGPANRMLARFTTYERMMQAFRGKLFRVRRMKETPLPDASTFLDRQFLLQDVRLDSDPASGRAILPASVFARSNPK